MSDAEKKKFTDRIKWLQEKLAEMNRVDGPDYTPSILLRGRVQGEIGGVKWALAALEGTKP